jgi:hypothetical protein
VTLLAGFVVNPWGHNRGLTVASGPSLVRDDRSLRLPRQDFAPNLSAKRRLCNTVGGRIVEGCAACCCALSAARSRAATTTNLARSSLALVLRAIFGGAKSCALVNLSMICPRWSAGGQPTTTNSSPDRGHLMASLTGNMHPPAVLVYDRLGDPALSHACYPSSRSLHLRIGLIGG